MLILAKAHLAILFQTRLCTIFNVPLFLSKKMSLSISLVLFVDAGLHSVFLSSHTMKQTLSLSNDKWGRIGDVHVCQHKQDQMIAQQEETTGNPMIFD